MNGIGQSCHYITGQTVKELILLVCTYLFFLIDKIYKHYITPLKFNKDFLSLHPEFGPPTDHLPEVIAVVRVCVSLPARCSGL